MIKKKNELESHESTPTFTSPWRYLGFVVRQSSWQFFVLVSVTILVAIAGKSLSYFSKLIVEALESGDVSQVTLWVLLFPVAFFLVRIIDRAMNVFDFYLLTQV